MKTKKQNKTANCLSHSLSTAAFAAVLCIASRIGIVSECEATRDDTSNEMLLSRGDLDGSSDLFTHCHQYNIFAVQTSNVSSSYAVQRMAMCNAVRSIAGDIRLCNSICSVVFACSGLDVCCDLIDLSNLPTLFCCHQSSNNGQ